MAERSGRKAAGRRTAGSARLARSAVASGAGQRSGEGRDGAVRPRILSSAHLAEGPAGELSEFEFGLMVAHNAFGRWVVRCMSAAGMPELAVTDVLVLHHVHHRGRPKKLSDICFTLNYEDAHVVSYALKKLAGLGLVASSRQGKEVFHETTATGRALVERYREVRAACLLPAVAGEPGDVRPLAEAAQWLRSLSGLYDQAARAAASL